MPKIQFFIIVTIPVVVVSSGFGVVTVDVSVTNDVVDASLAVVGVTSVGFVTGVVPVGPGASEAVTDSCATNIFFFAIANIHYYAHIKTALCSATCLSPLTNAA